MAVRTVGDRPNHGHHLVHHVVWEMAVQHPVADILGIELNVPGLCNSDKYGVLIHPTLNRTSSAFGSRNNELHSVQVNWVMIHTDIDKAYAHALPLLDDHRRRCRP